MCFSESWHLICLHSLVYEQEHLPYKEGYLQFQQIITTYPMLNGTLCHSVRDRYKHKFYYFVFIIEPC